MGFESLFGDTLVNNKGEKTNSSGLNGKFVLIYFSAQWCPPCHHFTPILADFYNRLKLKRSDFELVFVSSDRGESNFQEYFSGMPWLALPFEKRDLKAKLSSEFKVQGIPTLVVLDGEGNLITSKAREKVSSDPDGAQFPWQPLPLTSLIGTDFISKGKTPIKNDLKGKIFGLYFSAHWCPPCRAFTPKLTSTYNELKKEGKDFEIVFVSFDRTEEGFNEYFAEMPWTAIPFEESARRNTLGEHFEVEGIPALVFLDENLNIITKDGVSAVRRGLPFPFVPPAFAELDEDTLPSINEEPVLILFPSPEETGAVKASLAPLAEELRAAKKGVTFLLASEPEVATLVRQFANLPEGTSLVLLDVPAQAKFLPPKHDLGVEAVRAFVGAYHAKSLTPSKIRD